MEQEDFLNEDRFLETYINSKIRVNKWGKIKIRYALQQKGANSDLVDSHLKGFSDTDYRKVIESLITDRYRSLKEPEHAIKKNKTYQFLLRKGFESDLILDVIHEVLD